MLHSEISNAIRDHVDTDNIYFNSSMTTGAEFSDWATLSPSGQPTRRAQLCQPRLNNLTTEAACLKPPTDQGESWDVLMWFIIAQIFSGLSVSASFVLGISYIDANAPKEKLPVYLGRSLFITAQCSGKYVNVYCKLASTMFAINHIML
jgi:hypothetical protein